MKDECGSPDERKSAAIATQFTDDFWLSIIGTTRSPHPLIDKRLALVVRAICDSFFGPPPFFPSTRARPSDSGSLS